MLPDGILNASTKKARTNRKTSTAIVKVFTHCQSIADRRPAPVHAAQRVPLGLRADARRARRRVLIGIVMRERPR